MVQNGAQRVHLGGSVDHFAHWGLVGAFCGPWRDIWTPGGHLGEHFLGFRNEFGDLGGPFGLIWGAFGLIWGAFGSICEALGVVWEASVDHLGSFSELWRSYDGKQLSS